MLPIPITKQNFLEHCTNWIAAGLLAVMFILAITSMIGDSAIMDEIAHIPAGYSYVRYFDYRINPEHPPLLKSLAGIPLLFMNLNFPLDHSSWTQDINGQWTSGPEFIYERNDNRADQIIFWARFPMVLVMMLLGFFVFKWTKELAGKKAALLATFLFAFSPNIIAHGRFVTTDVGLAAFLIISLYYFVKFLKQPSSPNMLKFGLTFGLVQLAKFSAFMLIPYYILIAVLWIIVKIVKNKSEAWQYIKTYVGKTIVAMIIGYLLVGAVYGVLTIKEPSEIIKRDINSILNSNEYYNKYGFVKNSFLSLTEKPILKGYSVYGLGLTMVMQRATGGNTTYFLGEVSSAGWKHYFPVTFLMKEPIPALIIIGASIIALIMILGKKVYDYKLSISKYWRGVTDYALSNPAPLVIFGFIALYWLSSITSNLNIGYRHILPTVPLMYILSVKIMAKVDNFIREKVHRQSYYAHLVIIGILGIWLVGSNLYNYPLYLPYFNEVIGSKNGYKWIVDSNVDWGQDLKRLAKFVKKNNIDKIHLDYFGGGSAKYYLGDKYDPWWSAKIPEQWGWYAVSATPYRTSFENPKTSYNWLDQYELNEVVGNSILVYKVEPKK